VYLLSICTFLCHNNNNVNFTMLKSNFSTIFCYLLINNWIRTIPWFYSYFTVIYTSVTRLEIDSCNASIHSINWCTFQPQPVNMHFLREFNPPAPLYSHLHLQCHPMVASHLHHQHHHLHRHRQCSVQV